jgi:hypothetical protein
MRSRARAEKRLQKETPTVGERRSERQEQERLGSKSNVEAVVTKEKRLERLREKESEIAANPRRTARPGKPLKR